MRRRGIAPIGSPPLGLGADAGSPAVLNRNKKIIYSLLVLLLLLLAQESILRALFPIPEVTNFNRITYSNTAPSLHNKVKYLSNDSFTWASDPDGVEYVHSLNIYGFRDKTWRVEKPEKGVPRIMFIGDSLVEGFMAADHETIPMGFERRSAERGRRVEAMNLGVGASQVPQYLRLIRDAVPIFHPDFLVLVLYANDLTDLPKYRPDWLANPIVPDFSNPFSPRLLQIVRQFFETGRVTLRWKSKPFPYLAAVPSPRNPWSSQANVKHFNGFVSNKVATAMKTGRFNYSLVDSYARERDGLKKRFDIRPHLVALRRVIKLYSCELFVVYIPTCNQVSDAYLDLQKEYNSIKSLSSLTGEEYQQHARTLARVCDTLDLPYLDLTPILAQLEQRGERLYWGYDSHMKGQTYLRVGQIISDWFWQTRQPDG